MAFELNADGDDTYDQEAEEMIRMKQSNWHETSSMSLLFVMMSVQKVMMRKRKG